MLHSAPPKYEKIYLSLKNAISQKQYRTGTRLPSEAQLVKSFRVSRPTVIRALRDLQSEGLIERRAGSGSFVTGASASDKSIRQLGVLVPGLAKTEIFSVICGELAGLARSREYGLLWGSLPADFRNETAAIRELCAQFTEKNVAGVFFAPFELDAGSERVNRSVAELLRQAGIPVVLLDSDFLPFPRFSDFDLVGLDNVAAGYSIAEHLYKLGCRRIAVVARPFSAPTVSARIAGIQTFLSRQEVVLRHDWVRLGNPADPKFVHELTSPRHWDAFICSNDETAAELLQSLEKVRWRVPDDVRLVGFDDVKFATLLRVPLTTVRQPCRDIAIAAFHAMLERIAEPSLPRRQILLAPQLIVRESCGAYLGYRNGF